jgi:hypothetical protein
VTPDNVRSSLASLARELRAKAGAALHANLPMLVLAVGLLGLIRGNLHVLFGTLLWICVVARFYRRVNQAPAMLPDDMRTLVRGLSRLVYLLLYVLMFFRIAIGIMRTAPRRPIFGPVEDFQSYLACGLIALATIHALAALYRHFLVRGVPAPLRYLSTKRPANIA